MEISTAHPRRISVYVKRGEARLATLKSTALISQFNASDSQLVAKEVEERP